MTKPAVPRARSPSKIFTRSPITWVATIATASHHPQRRRRQPAPAATSAALSNRNGIPMVAPKGASRSYAGALRAHMRSSGVPLHSKVVLGGRVRGTIRSSEEDSDSRIRYYNVEDVSSGLEVTCSAANTHFRARLNRNRTSDPLTVVSFMAACRHPSGD
jgi:hypothetical protein